MEGILLLETVSYELLVIIKGDGDFEYTLIPKQVEFMLFFTRWLFSRINIIFIIKLSYSYNDVFLGAVKILKKNF